MQPAIAASRGLLWSSFPRMHLSMSMVRVSCFSFLEDVGATLAVPVKVDFSCSLLKGQGGSCRMYQALGLAM